MADNEEDSLFGEVASGDSKTEDKDDLFADTTEVPLDDDKPKDSSSEQKKAEDEKPKGEAASIPVASQNGEESKRKKNEFLYQENDQSRWQKEELLEEESEDTFDINIKVSEPEKVGEGMSSFMVYKVTTHTSIPTFKSSEFTVKRRFSDFLGLHEKLNEKHLPYGRIVPPAPEKSVVGMTKVKMSKEEAGPGEFVERRKAALERYLNRTARHSKLREDPDFKEFLEAESLPKATQTSALSKGGFSRLVKNVGDAVSKMTSKMTESDQWFEQKETQIETLDQQLRKLHAASETLFLLRKDIVLNTAQFSKSCALLGNSEEHSGLSRALTQLAELEEKVEQLHRDQTETDFYLLCETLKDYIGLIQSVKASLLQRTKTWHNWQHAQATLTKKRENLVKLELAGKQEKIGPAQEEVKEWERKVEKGQEEFEQISKAIKKEMVRFESHRVSDFTNLIIKYMESLQATQQQLIKYWEGYLPEAKAIA